LGANSINSLIAAELSDLAYTDPEVDQATMTTYDNLEGWTDVSAAVTGAAGTHYWSARRRSKGLRLTPVGMNRLRHARKVWADARSGFESALDGARTADLRAELHAIVNSEF
jgi:hypothetical protein